MRKDYYGVLLLLLVFIVFHTPDLIQDGREQHPIKIQDPATFPEMKEVPKTVYNVTKVIPTRILGRGVTSKVSLVVNKTVMNYLQYTPVDREECVLKILQNFSWCPKLIERRGNALFTSFVGVPLTSENVPSDFRSQLRIILDDLRSVGVQHNDLVKPGGDFWVSPVDILVTADGKLSVVDFSWATVNGSYACNAACTENAPPEFQPVDDNKALEVIEKLHRNHSGFKKYVDPHRQVGSQSEVPHFSVDGQIVHVRGYQHYDAVVGGPITYLWKPRKFQYFEGLFSELHQLSGCSTLLDIGCSAGLLSLIAVRAGFSKVRSLDHDSEYIGMLQDVKHVLNYDAVVDPGVFSFGDPVKGSYDVVVVGALIHWVFTCTADFRSFDGIFAYLSTMARKYILIEWVDSEDPAIKELGHIDRCNSAVPLHPYDVHHFELSAQKAGRIISKAEIDGPTRVLYVIDVTSAGLK